jgi:hypothetical protein
MYWDVVEVKPEPGHRLFVRFKDGRAGRVQLQRKELTGVLAPLLDEQFFERVFIDCGAVAWPGDIDLAPDAMYAQVACEFGGQVGECTSRSWLPRFYELKDLLNDPSHQDAYFRDFEDEPQDETCLHAFLLWEKELQGLDLAAWTSLKAKAYRYLERKQVGRGHQQLFDALGEAFAYNYLRKTVGCQNVFFIPERSSKTPDLEGLLGSIRVLCEVKAINISDDEVQARVAPNVVRKRSNQMSEGFFRKLESDVVIAKAQLHSFDPNSEARHLVYFNVCTDDWPGFYNADYLCQISERLHANPPGVEVVVNMGFQTEATCVTAG